MSHEVEMIDGVAQMAYVGETPWHGLGKRVHNDLTPTQMLEEAGLNWTVSKHQGYYVNPKTGEIEEMDTCVLLRDTDQKVLDEVSTDWNPVQNQEIAEFFHDFVMEGDMEMHTAGSLKNGRVVWMLAKIKDSFKIGGRDEIDEYLLCSTRHQYGTATDVMSTPIRVVCWNTFSMALNDDRHNDFRISLDHRKKFNPELVKIALGLNKVKVANYREKAEFLWKKTATVEDMVNYFADVFPFTGDTSDVPVGMKMISQAAKKATEVLWTQPGAEIGAGSWWHAFNTVTYAVDHELGRGGVDGRLHSAWFGEGQKRKQFALDKALELAKAA